MSKEFNHLLAVSGNEAQRFVYGAYPAGYALYTLLWTFLLSMNESKIHSSSPGN